MTSADFLNIAVGTGFIILVFATIYMLLRLTHVLDQLSEVLVETKDTTKNAREIMESGRRVADKVEGAVGAVSDTTVGVISGLVKGFAGGRRRRRK